VNEFTGRNIRMLPETFTPSFLRQIELLRVRSRRTFLGARQGAHASLRKGHGIEFSDFRKYELGDNPRDIDWGVYARSDKLFVKRFKEEENLSVLLIIDGSSSMTRAPNESKWQSARDLALALSYAALMDQDTITISVPGNYQSPSFSGAKSIHTIGKQVLELKVGGNPDMASQINLAASRIRFPGKAIFLSDFLMPIEVLEKSFNILRAKNLDITAIQILSPNDFEPYKGLENATLIDSETEEIINIALDSENRAEYSELLEEHNRKVQDFFSAAQIQYTIFKSDESLLDFIIKNLTLIGLLKRS